MLLEPNDTFVSCVSTRFFNLSEVAKKARPFEETIGSLSAAAPPRISSRYLVRRIVVPAYELWRGHLPSFPIARLMVSPTSFPFGYLLASHKRSSSTGADDHDHPCKKSRPGDVVDPLLYGGWELLRVFGVLCPSVAFNWVAYTIIRFTQMAEVEKYVDKSLALQDFLKLTLPVHLLRPRRSGKTTLLRLFRWDLS